MQLVEKLFQALPMRLLYLDGADHDVHTAYVSHISHITSFALALTVLEKEKEEQRIFDLASGGFESTVRLAKSAPATWVPIFRQNRLNVLDVLDEHLHQLQLLRELLAREDYVGLTRADSAGQPHSEDSAVKQGICHPEQSEDLITLEHFVVNQSPRT